MSSMHHHKSTLALYGSDICQYCGYGPWNAPFAIFGSIPRYGELTSKLPQTRLYIHNTR